MIAFQKCFRIFHFALAFSRFCLLHCSDNSRTILTIQDSKHPCHRFWTLQFSEWRRFSRFLNILSFFYSFRARNLKSTRPRHSTRSNSLKFLLQKNDKSSLKLPVTAEKSSNDFLMTSFSKKWIKNIPESIFQVLFLMSSKSFSSALYASARKSAPWAAPRKRIPTNESFSAKKLNPAGKIDAWAVWLFVFKLGM